MYPEVDSGEYNICVQATAGRGAPGGKARVYHDRYRHQDSSLQQDPGHHARGRRIRQGPGHAPVGQSGSCPARSGIRTAAGLSKSRQVTNYATPSLTGQYNTSPEIHTYIGVFDILNMPNTSEICTRSGYYRFVRYTDGTTQPPPTNEEREIPMRRGEQFPPIRSSGKSAYWAWNRD